MFEQYKIKRLIKQAKEKYNTLEKNQAFELAIQISQLKNIDITEVCQLIGFNDTDIRYNLLDYLLHSGENTNHNLTYDEELEYIELKLKKNMISNEEYDLQKNTIDFKYHKIDTIDYDLNAIDIKLSYIDNNSKNEDDIADIIALKEEKIEKMYEHEMIDIDEKMKHLHTLYGEKWFKFEFALDSDVPENEQTPSTLQVIVDYNKYFIQWLKDSEFALKDEETENIAMTPEKEEELLIEKWVNKTIIGMSAALLVDQNDPSVFSSVMANEPEGTIVEKVELDKGKLPDEYNTEEIRNLEKKITNKRWYR